MTGLLHVLGQGCNWSVQESSPLGAELYTFMSGNEFYLVQGIWADSILMAIHGSSQIWRSDNTSAMTNSVSPGDILLLSRYIYPQEGSHCTSTSTQKHICAEQLSRGNSGSIIDRHETSPISSAWIYKGLLDYARELHLYIVNRIDLTWKLICQECHLLNDFK